MNKLIRLPSKFWQNLYLFFPHDFQVKENIILLIIVAYVSCYTAFNNLAQYWCFTLSWCYWGKHCLPWLDLGIENFSRKSLTFLGYLLQNFKRQAKVPCFVELIVHLVHTCNICLYILIVVSSSWNTTFIFLLQYFFVHRFCQFKIYVAKSPGLNHANYLCIWLVQNCNDGPLNSISKLLFRYFDYWITESVSTQWFSKPADDMTEAVFISLVVECPLIYILRFLKRGNLDKMM